MPSDQPRKKPEFVLDLIFAGLTHSRNRRHPHQSARNTAAPLPGSSSAQAPQIQPHDETPALSPKAEVTVSPTFQQQPAAHPYPARMTLRVLLTYLITATLIATFIVLTTATTSHAAPGHHRPATWNMQGASSSSDSKWTTTVARLATGGNNYLPHDVVALQEAGPRSSLPGTVVRTGNITVNGRQATYQYEVRRWRVGSASRGRDVYITWLNTDPTGNRNNVAIVTHEDPGTPTAVAASQANNNTWGMRPALGVRLADGSRFWSFHASSNGDNRSNDAQNMLVEIQSASSPGMWAVLGDFNRRPDNLTVPPGSQIYSSGQGTQQGGGELDYMVSNDRQNMNGWTGRRLNGAGSDHYPLEFSFRASSGQGTLQSESDPHRCLTRGIAAVAPVTTADLCDKNEFDQAVEATKPIRFSASPAGRCITPHMSAGGPSIGYPPHFSDDCVNAVLSLQPDSSIRLLEFCLTQANGWNTVLQRCSDDTRQKWIDSSAAPYFWGFVSRIGPSTGTEDAATAGSGTTPPPSSCPMPPNPTLEPCAGISKRSADGRYFESVADVAIPDNQTGSAYSPITVAGVPGNAPSTLKVGVDIKHSYRGDLNIWLIAPDGTDYLLESFPRSDGTQNVLKTYTVNASPEIANGTWNLWVQDFAPGDTGIVDAWNLTF